MTVTGDKLVEIRDLSVDFHGGGRVTNAVKRINITLPEATLRLLDRVAPRGDRSRFIKEAVHAYVEMRGKGRLKHELKAGAKARASRDLALTAEWLAVDEGTWPARRK